MKCSEFLLILAALASTSCAARTTPPVAPPGPAGSVAQNRVAAKAEVDAIELPELILCVLKRGALPPPRRGGESPSCVARTTFTPIGMVPERSAEGEFGIILKLSSEDQNRLSHFSEQFQNQYALLLRRGAVLSNFVVVGGKTKEFHVVFDDEEDSDLFFRTMLAN